MVTTPLVDVVGKQKPLDENLMRSASVLARL